MFISVIFLLLSTLLLGYLAMLVFKKINSKKIEK